MVLAGFFPYVQRWRKVWPISHQHRMPDRSFSEIGNTTFRWKSDSYRQDHFVFDERVSRVVVQFSGGPTYTVSTSAWGLFTSGDFRNADNGLLVLSRAEPAAGTFSMGSGGGGHEFYIDFQPVYGEAFK